MYLGPARNALNYHKYVFNAAPDLTSPYVGDSRPSLDLAWHELLASKYHLLRAALEKV